MGAGESREKLKNSWALQINWKWNRMWTATWTLGERRLSIQCQPKRGRQGTERDEEKRWKKKQRAQILANRHPTGSTSAVLWLYPTQSSWKRFATDSDRLSCLLSLSLSLCLLISAHILLYSSLCLPLSLSTSLFFYLSLSVCPTVCNGNLRFMNSQKN